ncbi:putative zinc finger protein [Orchesella cincta]|uniref:Putative zinc finger protein n=1 Tax=Orchesella cincta TaxID=48709 RepID=A0A1D2N6A5_ORCCI|nr:putative zinc finger protein [Orchesella cincta]
MDFEGTNSPENQNLEEMYKSLTNISKQLQLLQDFVQSKFGNEFTKFCELSETTMNQSYASTAESNSLHEDNEDYDKMPNLVSQESPSRTLGYVTVPLRQTNSGLPTPKLHPAPSATAGSSKRGDRSSFSKEGGLQSANDNEDMMLQLHNFPDLLVENTGEMDTGETPEFLEMELDPNSLLRGEPPPLHPMFADNDQDINLHIGNGNSSGTHTKRSVSRQSGASFNRMESDASTRVSRRASFGGHENSGFQKKFDCLICGIKFEFAETLKSHMDSHAGARNMRSNSEDQSALGSNSANAPPLPKLMPRPSIPTPNSAPHSLEIKSEPPVTRLPSRSKKSSSSSSMSPSSSTSVSSRAAAMKRRKRYNQSRPCSLACPECGLKIRDKSRLIEHLRGHTGERPFQCFQCDKSYTRKDVLKTHMIKMHGEAP